MKIINDAVCVEVAYASDKKKATMTLFNKEEGKIYEVNFNKQSYSNGKYVDDPKKEESVKQMIAEDTGLTFDTLGNAIGQLFTVYSYPKFSSLHPVDVIEKFTPDMKGEIYSTTIKEIIEDTYAIKIRYEIDGKTYESKMTHGKYLEDLKLWAQDDVKKEKQYAKFKEKFGVSVNEKDTLIGKPIMVEIKAAFGSIPYGDIKKLPKSN